MLTHVHKTIAAYCVLALAGGFSVSDTQTTDDAGSMTIRQRVSPAACVDCPLDRVAGRLNRSFGPWQRTALA
ncbi:MAG: hypothetical protein L0Y44_00525 [Phycisphaerales bacterium]|nr:hypothetical protein [Phycisphaerales bacterium]